MPSDIYPPLPALALASRAVFSLWQSTQRTRRFESSFDPPRLRGISWSIWFVGLTLPQSTQAASRPRIRRRTFIHLLPRHRSVAPALAASTLTRSAFSKGTAEVLSIFKAISNRLGKEKPRHAFTCRGSHRVHRGWRRNTHTVPEMYPKGLCRKTPPRVYSASVRRADTVACTRLRSRSSALASSQAAMAWSACSSCALMVDSARCMRRAVALTPRSLR